MTQEGMIRAFEGLDKRLPSFVRLIVGGGAAMVAAHGIPVSTQDVDGVPDKTSMELATFKKEVRSVGRELAISQDWLNDYFSTFLFVLPSDYGKRLKTVYKGQNLEVAALGKEDLILMKCFAGREKDIPHLRALLKKGADLTVIDNRFEELVAKKIPSAQRAADLFSDLCGELGIA